MASGHTRGQKPSPFGLAPICFSSRTGTEHKKQPLPKALSALVGISNSALSLSVVTRGGDWIIDPGSTDHMTCDPHKFINFPPNCSKIAIVNANGIRYPIEGVGTISLSPSIFDVLFVPTLNCNLLSVNKLTKSHSCVALFYPTHCFFQNIHSKEKIGSGRERRTVLSRKYLTTNP